MNKKADKRIDQKHIKYILLAVIIAAVTMISAAGAAAYSKRTTDSISHQIIRFHVVANSDTTEDQLLKQKVRDEVIGFIEPLVKECESVDETRELLEASLPVIKEIAEEVIANNGKDYSVYAAIDKANFPTKAYGDIVLPAGEYEACRIVIGEGKGENWWCVMYPPLCYLDVASGVVPVEGKEELREQLSEEQYDLVQKNKGVDYQIRFKIVDTVNALLHQSNYKER